MYHLSGIFSFFVLVYNITSVQYLWYIPPLIPSSLKFFDKSWEKNALCSFYIPNYLLVFLLIFWQLTTHQVKSSWKRCMFLYPCTLETFFFLPHFIIFSFFLLLTYIIIYICYIQTNFHSLYVSLASF